MGFLGNLVRLSGAIVLLAGMFLLHIAVDKAVFLAECERGLPGEMQSMEDVDIATCARELAGEGNMNAALAILLYGMEAASVIRKKQGVCLRAMRPQKKSAIPSGKK